MITVNKICCKEQKQERNLRGHEIRDRISKWIYFCEFLSEGKARLPARKEKESKDCPT
jgi:hypothetical protein